MCSRRIRIARNVVATKSLSSRGQRGIFEATRKIPRCARDDNFRVARARLAMQRLYLQFYVTILVVLAVFVGAAALLWRLADEDNRTPQYLDVAAELTGALLPDVAAPKVEQQKAVEALHRKLRFDIALYRANGEMIAMAGKVPPRFNVARARVGWRRGPGGPNFTLQLPDGRWLVARQGRERPNPSFRIAAL